MAEAAEIQRQGAIFSPEGVMMLTIFGILDIIDFFIASVLVVDIIATLFYFLWVYFRSQTKGIGEIRVGEVREEIAERRAEREEKRAELKERQAARKAAAPKKGVWLRRVLFVLEWIPIVGMIPGWTFMVYSELKS